MYDVHMMFNCPACLGALIDNIGSLQSEKNIVLCNQKRRENKIKRIV